MTLEDNLVKITERGERKDPYFVPSVAFELKTQV